MATTASRLDIYNMALGFIGTRTIASPDENCPEAIQCNQFWNRARRMALRDFPWNFATKRVQLAEVDLPDVYEGEWAHAYGWPNKALKIHRIHPRGREPRHRAFPYEVRNLGDSNIILTNVEAAQAEVTFDVERIDLYDELFVMALARLLAALVCVPLQRFNPQKVQELMQLYQLAIPAAQGQNASEEEERQPLDTWLAARGAW